jgi:Zn-dependent protease
MLPQIDLAKGVMYLIPLVLSLTVHEWAHAYSAFRLGDDTAARMGRMTLNPIPHIDPIGTLLVPMLQIPFGWAKPVPVAASRFRRDITMRAGIMITSMAGPLSNLVLAVICSILYGLLLRFRVGAIDKGLGDFFDIGIQMNLGLFLFNFLPIPPLDGSRIADGLMPYRWRPQWEQFERYAWIVLLLVIVSSRYFGLPLLRAPIGWMYGYAQRLINVVAGPEHAFVM